VSDGEERKRPNANYRLSKESADPDEIVYHYDRERRLEKAPQSVRDLYKDSPPRRFSLLGPLVGSKPRAMLFATIMIASLLIIAISFLNLASDTYDFDGNRLTVQAILFEDIVIVALKKSVGSGPLARMNRPYTGAVNIGVAPAMKAGEAGEQEDVFYNRIFFSAAPKESYSFAVPFNSGELLLVFQSEKKTLSVKIKPE